jgi:Bromodomain
MPDKRVHDVVVLLQIIKKPMDLGTIQQKLEKGEYK